MSEAQKSVDSMQLALYTTFTTGQGETSFTQLLIALGHFDDIPTHLPIGEMAALVHGQNQARALMRRMGLWPDKDHKTEKAEAIARAYLQAR
jgi:hypothetical protein